MTTTIMTDSIQIIKADNSLCIHYICGWDDDQSWKYTIWFTPVEGGVQIKTQTPSGGYLLGVAHTADEAVELVTKDQEDAPVGYVRWCFQHVWEHE